MGRTRRRRSWFRKVGRGTSAFFIIWPGAGRAHSGSTELGWPGAGRTCSVAWVIHLGCRVRDERASAADVGGFGRAWDEHARQHGNCFAAKAVSRPIKEITRADS